MTTLVTAAGPINVIHAEITEPLVGAWTARVEIDSDDPIVGPVVLNEGLTAWAGVQKRGAQEHGRTIALLVGGTGGLSGALGVKNYNAPFIGDILADIMIDAGEVLSPDVSAALLTAKVERWSRRAGAGGLSLQQIADETTADHWRIRRDGRVWLGTEAYPVVPESFQFIETTRDPAQDTITIAPEDNQILVAAGDNFLGRNVAGVVTTIDPGEVRQVISWEPESGPTGDRVLGPFRTIVEAFVGRQIDYAKVYPSVVKFQNPDGTLDLLPDDESIRGDGFKCIIITLGLPGVTVTVPIGGRVNLYFQDGDPKKPRAGLWEGSGVTAWTIDGGTDFVALAAKVLTELSVIKAAYDIHIHTDPASGFTGVPTVLMTPPSSVASTTLKTT